jgi:DNA-directed RNA polymerase subunit M/transcription elongation factor TFIIS
MKNETKRIMPAPPPLHDGLSLEGRWRTVRLLTSLSPCQDPLELEKNVFLQSGGDWTLYEAGVYRLACTLKYKAAEVSTWSAEQVVLEVEEFKSPETVARAPSNVPSLPTVECQIKCGRCKSTHVSVEQKQTRGADESMTVFVQCENCGLRWKM